MPERLRAAGPLPRASLHIPIFFLLPMQSTSPPDPFPSFLLLSSRLNHGLFGRLIGNSRHRVLQWIEP